MHYRVYENIPKMQHALLCRVCLSASFVCPLSRLAIKSKSEKCHTACGRRQCSSNNNNCSRNSSANDNNNNNNRASGNCCSRIKCVVASYSLPLWLRRITWPKANSVQRCRIAKVRDGGSRRRQRGRELPDRAQFEFAFDARSIDGSIAKEFCSQIYRRVGQSQYLTQVNWERQRERGRE